MNDKTAHAKLKKIQEENNGYRNSRRERNTANKSVNELLNQISKVKAVSVPTAGK